MGDEREIERKEGCRWPRKEKGKKEDGEVKEEK